MKVRRFIEVAPRNSEYSVTEGTPNTKASIHPIKTDLTKTRHKPKPEKKKEF